MMEVCKKLDFASVTQTVLSWVSDKTGFAMKLLELKKTLLGLSAICWSKPPPSSQCPGSLC